MDISSRVPLNDGNAIPQLGLGTWQLKDGPEAKDAVFHALSVGYRHIDTAAIYANERSVGTAIRDSGIPREDIFVTTKLWNTDHHHPATALQKSLERLRMDYVDLYLIHFPVERVRNDTWKALTRLAKQGKARSVGVSNFTIAHLKELLASTDIVPAVNQVEFTPYLYQKELLEFCEAKGIKVEAYCPLTRGKMLKDPKLLALAQEVKRTPAQVLIRWGLQHGLIELPKSRVPERIEENCQVFDFSLSEGQMAVLDTFDEGLRIAWDPTSAP